MQVWHAIRNRCDSLGFQVHPRSVNFDLRTVGYSYAAVPGLSYRDFQHLAHFSKFAHLCLFLLSNVCDFGLCIYMISL